jgi:hypothetical protein
MGGLDEVIRSGPERTERWVIRLDPHAELDAATVRGAVTRADGLNGPANKPARRISGLAFDSPAILAWRL